MKPDLNTIRKVREFLFSKTYKDNSISPLPNLTDFFSASHIRDLLFHEQEHTFNLLEIRELLEESRLEFCGFSVSYDLPTARLNENTYFNMENWHEIEQQNPNLFIGMYQFYCQRKR